MRKNLVRKKGTKWRVHSPGKELMDGNAEKSVSNAAE